MWRRSIFSVAAVAAALLASGRPALAGGWAVTTFDALPEGGFRAGETYRLSYTIRQHGDKPFAGAKTEIRIRSVKDDGDVAVFPGGAEGAVGHYVAEVRFPATGDWTWEVTQGPFQPQPLGTMTVLEPGASASGVGVSTTAPAVLPPARAELAALRVALSIATLLALALFAHRLFLFTRRRRIGPDPAAPRIAGAAE